MSENNDRLIYDYADKFINLANEIAQTDRSGKVGIAIRFAAARYSAYEASLRTNLAEDKDKQLQDFTNAFKEMLQINIEDYINILSQK